jgi:hypothetical protein
MWEKKWCGRRMVRAVVRMPVWQMLLCAWSRRCEPGHRRSIPSSSWCRERRRINWRCKWCRSAGRGRPWLNRISRRQLLFLQRHWAVVIHLDVVEAADYQCRRLLTKFPRARPRRQLSAAGDATVLLVSVVLWNTCLTKLLWLFIFLFIFLKYYHIFYYNLFYWFYIFK